MRSFKSSESILLFREHTVWMVADKTKAEILRKNTLLLVPICHVLLLCDENVPGSGLIWCFGYIVFCSRKMWKGLYTFLAVLWLKELQSNLLMYQWIKICKSIRWVFRLSSLFWMGHLHFINITVRWGKLYV